MSRWNFSNPVRQNFAVIFIIAVFLIAASYYWFFPILNLVENDVVSEQRGAALRLEDSLGIFFDLTLSDIRILGALVWNHIRRGEKSDIKDEIQNMFAGRGDFISVHIFDKNGNLVESGTAKTPPLSPANSSLGKNTIFLKEALDNKFYISPVSFGASGPTLQISAPIEIEGKIEAVVLVELDFSRLWRIVSDTKIDNGKVYVVDERGTIIADPNIALASSGENLKYREVVASLLRGLDNIKLSRYTNENGVETVAYGLRVPLTKWGIIVEQETSKAFEERSKSMIAAVVFSGASFALVLLLLFNIIRLMRALNAIEQGRREREQTIAFLPDGVIEYTGENQILTINPAAKRYLDIADLPANIYVSESAAIPAGLEKLWAIFFTRKEREGGQGNTYEISFQKPERRTLQIITVYIKGTGHLAEQRYLKIIHDITHEHPL